MATYTSYLNLEKPTTSETFNLLKMNQNWDKIDAGVSALNSKLTPIAGELTDIITPSRRDMAKYSVYGNVCTIFMNNVAFSGSYSADTAVFNCPYKPMYPTRFIMYDQDMNIIPCFVNVTTGDVTINGYTGGKLLYGSVTFVCVRD